MSISGSFADLDRHWIDVDCPRCRLSTLASLRDVRLGNVIICRGCKANIRLVDHMAQYHRARQRIERSFRQLFAAFER